MRLKLIMIILVLGTRLVNAQNRPDICKFCKQDTTLGYVSIEDTSIWNPVCNYEVLTKNHVQLSEKLKLDRTGVKFYPHILDKEYKKSGDDRGHVLSWEDLAYDMKHALGSYNLKRNLAPQPHNENIGTKYKSEELGRTLAIQYDSIKVYGGTYGTLGNDKGINKPKFYWTVFVTPVDTEVYWMATTKADAGQGNDITQEDLPSCKKTYQFLISQLKFDPIKVIR